MVLFRATARRELDGEVLVELQDTRKICLLRKNFPVQSRTP